MGSALIALAALTLTLGGRQLSSHLFECNCQKHIDLLEIGARLTGRDVSA
jgi:hypothetical protein